ncbi:hypothetical protein FRC17_004182 [Serendipita sp. 399]|nr:hypothetical protein FRC17_004182 [Serendipita sp. 399]
MNAHNTSSTGSVSDEERLAQREQPPQLGIDTTFEEEDTILVDSDDDDEEAMYEHADDTRLRYERLQARGRAAELAYNERVKREREDAQLRKALRERERSRSHSKSRSRPATPLHMQLHGLGALFKKDNFVLGVTRSQSPPATSVTPTEKSSRRPSVSNLFKFKPISRSSSSKSIHHPASTSSSVPTSPFPSPLTPMSPLPSFFSPKSRRKAIPNGGEDVSTNIVEDGMAHLSFGSPLARAKRRPSPARSRTLPVEDRDSYFLEAVPTQMPLRRPGHGASAATATHSQQSFAAHRRRSPHLTYGVGEQVLEDSPSPLALTLHPDS